MTSKLLIDLKSGQVSVEGEEKFVRDIYADFKDTILSRAASANFDEKVDSEQGDPTPKKRSKRKAPKNQATKQSGEKKAKSTSSPTLVKDLDVSGLSKFRNKYEPKNQPDRVLVFAKYLQSIGIAPCTVDQVYTCYMSAKEVLPKVFAQAVRDAHGRNYGFIEYDSEGIQITNIGENHLNKDLQKSEPDE